MSIDELYSEFSIQLADKAIVEAIRYGQANFDRQGDTIVMKSKSFPSIRLECEIIDKQYNNDNELAHESLSTIISVKRNGKNVLQLDTSENLIKRPSATGEILELSSNTVRKLLESFNRAKNNRSDTEPLF